MKNGSRGIPASIQAEFVRLYNDAKWDQLNIAADRVTKRYPRDPLGWRASGKACLILGEFPKAIDLLSRLVRLVPGDADGFNDLGSALLALGRTDEAVENYRRAVALNPRQAEAFSNLGRALCGLNRFEEAVKCCETAISISPASAGAHNNLGNALSEIGRPIEAEASYHQSLAIRPGYLDAMINLGSLLGNLDRWPEALSCYRQAVQIHPNSGMASGALGRVLSRLTGADDEAKSCLERAIALNAGDNNTYVELGNVLMRQRQTDAALVMFRRAQELVPLITWPANQQKASFSALFLDTPMGGSTPVNYLAGKAGYDRHFHCVIPDTPVDIELLLGKADVVFNMICNADDGAAPLWQALDLVRRLDRPTINHPRLILDTDRATVARRLSEVPECAVPRTIRVSRSVVEEAVSKMEIDGLNLPFLIRVAGTHGGDDFERCDGWSDVTDFMSANSAANYYMIEYLEYRSDDGYFRKYRVICIDGEIFPYHLAIHDQWKVHHFRTRMAEHLWMRQEEERFVNNIGEVFTPAQQDVLRSIAAVIGVDYGGIDCAMNRDGRIVVFEANAAMLVHDEKSSEFAYKNHAIAMIKSAFDDMVSRRRHVSGEKTTAVPEVSLTPVS